MYLCTIFCSYKNGSKFLKNYIDNLLEQSIFNQIEFIFLDCDDNPAEEMLKLSRIYKNIKYIRLEKDPGLYASWNIALKNSSTEYLSNWNIDDRKSQIGIQLLYNFLNKNQDIDLVYGQTFISEIANEKYLENNMEQIFPCHPPSLESFLKNNSPHCMPMWRKKIHEKYGYFDESYKIASDSDMWIRAIIGGSKMKMLNHPVGLYYYNPEGVSTNPAKLKQSIEEVSAMRAKYTKYIK